MLERKLERIGRRADPSRAFIVALGKRLRYGRPKHTALWKVAMTSMTSVSVLLLGTGSYAYASDSVLPDHPLYGVRQTIESAESALAITPTLKARVDVQLLRRRLQEEKVLAKRKKAITVDHVNRFVAQAEKAIEANRQTDRRTGVELDATISSMEQEHASLLEQLREEKLLDDQTSELQGRVKMLTVTRQEAYRTLLERKIQTVSTIEDVDAIMKELEDAYAEITAQLDAEKTVIVSTDDAVDHGANIPDLTERSITIESQD